MRIIIILLIALGIALFCISGLFIVCLCIASSRNSREEEALFADEYWARKKEVGSDDTDP